MILAVNLGNTNLRAAVGHKAPESFAVMPTADLDGPGAFTSFIVREFGASVWSSLTDVVISSVTPDKTAAVTEAVKIMLGKPPLRFKERAALDLSGYDGQLGEDRIACCAGALLKYTPPFVLIDFGTATTVNIVDKDGKFIGGAILAGLRIGLMALSEHTAQLPNTELCAAAPIIGHSTSESLISGAVVGTACAAEGFVRRIESELGHVTVIVTGGHAPFVLPHCGFESVHEPNILFDGLFSLI